MTNSKTKFGMLGMAALVAVLAVSLMAFAPMAQEAKANAANKFGTTTSTTTFLTDRSGSDLPAVIVEYPSKAQDKQNIYSEFITECTTQTLVKGQGGKDKNTSSDSASAGALVWWTISWDESAPGVRNHHLISPYGYINSDVWDEDPASVPSKNLWHICGQQMDIDVDLNPIITKCTAEFAADASCVEGQLVFACDEDDSIPDDECDQYVQIFLANWGTHSASQFIQDIPGGDYTLHVWGDSDIDLSDNVDPDDKTKVVLGKKVVASNPVNVDKSE